MPEHIIYSGHFVDKPEELTAKVGGKLTGEEVTTHAHHVTHAFRPEGLGDIKPGTKRTLHITGEVITDRVHAVTVESPDGSAISTKEHPHITIATAKGAKPVESDAAIAQAKQNGTIIPIHPPIPVETTEGYFDGKAVRLK